MIPDAPTRHLDVAAAAAKPTRSIIPATIRRRHDDRGNTRSSLAGSSSRAREEGVA
jgi:hypothetical protein